MLSMGDDSTYVGGPILDGTIVTADPSQLYAAGQGARVPLLIGATDMDLGFAFEDAKNIHDLLSHFGRDANKVRTAYHISDKDDLATTAYRIAGDQLMVEPARYVARLLSARQPVYEYRFSYVAESMREQWKGAPHASDVAFTAFDTVAASYGKDLTERDAAAAKTMHTYWVAFAASGKPEVYGQPAWPAYNAQSEVLMNITNSGPVVGPDPWRSRLDLIQQYTERHQLPNVR